MWLQRHGRGDICAVEPPATVTSVRSCIDAPSALPCEVAGGRARVSGARRGRPAGGWPRESPPRACALCVATSLPAPGGSGS